MKKFMDAQDFVYNTALSEIRTGQKRTHWMWFIFPQMSGLGRSDVARYYGIQDLAEAEEYLAHPVLRQRLVEIAHALIELPGNNATKIVGSPDDLKLKSSMTLFAATSGADPVFQQVLDKFYQGQKDEKTLRLLGQQSA